MSNNSTLQIFTYNENKVRVIDINGESWFVVKDVCKILGLSNPTASLENLDEDERSKFYLGRQGQANIISESGLYTLIMRSKKTEAKLFRKWVTSVVLPSILRHGFYVTPKTAEQILENPEILIKALQELQAERMKTKTLRAQIEANKDKVVFAEAVETNDESVLIGNFAVSLSQNGILFTQNQLFAYFRENGWLMRIRGRRWNMPTKKSLDSGFFEIEERVITKPDGGTLIRYTPKLTGKGQIFFINHFLDSKQKNETEKIG